MTDRKMFELAAKAAGKKIEYWHSNGSPMCRGEDGTPYAWNPRDNDGDAFRLAANLQISIEHEEGCITCDWAVNHNLSYDIVQEYYSVESTKDQILAATRLAIFQAAVEIGKAMP